MSLRLGGADNYFGFSLPRSTQIASVLNRSLEIPAESLPPEARRSILGDLREIVLELGSTRDLIHQLTLRDIRIRYKQAAFGFAWALLIPMAVVFAGAVIRYALALSAGRRFASAEIASMAIKSVPWAF